MTKGEANVSKEKFVRFGDLDQYLFGQFININFRKMPLYHGR